MQTGKFKFRGVFSGVPQTERSKIDSDFVSKRTGGDYDRRYQERTGAVIGDPKAMLGY